MVSIYFINLIDFKKQPNEEEVKEKLSFLCYDNLENLDSYFKTSTSRYDFPLSEAIHYNATCYDLSNDEATKVNYQFIKDNYRN